MHDVLYCPVVVWGVSDKTQNDFGYDKQGRGKGWRDNGWFERRRHTHSWVIVLCHDVTEWERFSIYSCWIFWVAYKGSEI